MSSLENWQSLDSLVGLSVVNDSDAVKKAHLKRHPRHDSYTPANKIKRLSRAESKAYDALNERLHEELRRVSKEHFAETPIPRKLQSDHAPWFTPFTYQNYDWYGPSFECYIVVIGKYLDSNLLRKFQTLLIDDHRDWCVQVVVSESYEFENDHEIAVFSDQIIVHSDTATALSIQTAP